MKSKKRSVYIIGTLVLIVIAVAFVLLIINADKLQQIFFKPVDGTGKSASDSYKELQSVTIGGKKYMQRKELTNILIIGLDTFGEAVDSDSYNNSQQADFVTLVSLDSTAKTYTVLHLNRDTMTDINVLDITGTRRVRTIKAQLALAHTYGNGLHVSCKNTVDAVSDMLFGLRIDHYISMTMDAVKILTDELGGVTLTVNQDLTSVNPEWAEGKTVTLSGEDALEFVRLRQSLPDSSNLSRMERQKVFMSAVIDKLVEAKKTHTGNSYFISLYDSVAEYTVTDASATSFADIADNIADYTSGGILSPEGQAALGTEFMEFYADEEKLRELAIRLFYKED